MRTGRYNTTLRATSWVLTLTMAGMALLTPLAQARQLHERMEAAKPKPFSELRPGLTQSLTPAQWAKVDARFDAAHPRPDARPLSEKEMGQARGRGQYRSKYFAGTLPWHRSLRDVNLCNGNLFKSFTDIQVSPAKGAGLALQRTYNSNDDRVGPFGIGWTHAYDIRMDEATATDAASAGAASDGTASYQDQNFSDRVDFFGHPHRYHRDADGLYTPPPYLYDELDSHYEQTLTDGIVVDDDTQKSMDGTIKHFRHIGNARVCDYIQDRYTNTTTLTYENEGAPSTEEARLHSVTDPSGRTLIFTWTDVSQGVMPAGSAHVWRVTRVDESQYSVSYDYYTNTADAASLFNLKSVTLDPNPAGGSGHLNRKTSFAYQAADATIGGEPGILCSITDPLGHNAQGQPDATLGHNMLYTSSIYPDPHDLTKVLPTVWVLGVSEPASDPSHIMARQNWTIDSSGRGSNVKSDTGLTLVLSADSYYRVQGLSLPFFESGMYAVGYAPGTNNVSDMRMNFVSGSISAARTIHTVYLYGPHGNELLHRNSTAGDINNPRGADIFGSKDDVVITAYYNASQYFQKKSVTDANGRVTTFGVGSDSDPNIGNRGSVLWVQDAGYNVANNPSNGRQFNYTYYPTGQKASETDLKGTLTTYEYGGAGDAVNTQGQPLGNLTRVVQDAVPASPVNGRTYLQRTTTMNYDVVGHVLSSTDPMNLTSNFVYNVLGQPLTAQFPHKLDAAGQNEVTPSESVAYDYSEPNSALSNGRLRSVTQTTNAATPVTHTVSMDYELGCDRVKQVKDTLSGTNGFSHVLDYAYNIEGQRMSLSLPGGGTWTYEYTTRDKQGEVAEAMQLPAMEPDKVGHKLLSITDDKGNHTFYGSYVLNNGHVSIDGYGFDSYGRLWNVVSNIVTDSGGANTISYQQTHYTYDNLLDDDFHSVYADPTNGGSHGWLQKVSTSWHGPLASDPNNQTITRLLNETEYGYDLRSGQRTTATRRWQDVNATTGVPQATSSRTETYGYDEQYRLQTVNYGDNETQGYAFDAMGNRWQKTDTVSGATTTENSTFDAANRILTRGTQGYTSDLDGNTLADGPRTMTEQAGVRGQSGAYDGRGDGRAGLYAGEVYGHKHRTVCE